MAPKLMTSGGGGEPFPAQRVNQQGSNNQAWQFCECGDEDF